MVLWRRIGKVLFPVVAVEDLCGLEFDLLVFEISAGQWLFFVLVLVLNLIIDFLFIFDRWCLVPGLDHPQPTMPRAKGPPILKPRRQHQFLS